MAFIHSPKIVTSGLVLCLDAANKLSYPSTGTSWYDLTSTGYVGTLTNGPTFNGSNGGTIVFDGVDDYVSVSSAQSLNPGTHDYDILDDTWTVLTKDRKMSAQFEHSLVVTKTGADILTLPSI